MSLTRSKAVIELGKRLVTQLKAGDDLLASWMAHDIAGRIEVAESASGAAQVAAQNACAEAILTLWRHRSALPQHLRPLGEVEPVMRTLASLDVDQTEHRYFPDALRAAATADVDAETRQALELAFGIDYTARLLIQFSLREAAERASSNVEPWVELAHQAGAEEGADRPVVRFILEKGKHEEGEEAEEAYELERLRDRLARLEAFAEVASYWVATLRKQLDAEQLDKK